MTADDLDARFARLRQDMRGDVLASAADSRRHAEELLARSLQDADDRLERSRQHAPRTCLRGTYSTPRS